jgi:hypothetical protein
MITIHRTHKRASFHTAVAFANTIAAIGLTWPGKKEWDTECEIIISVNKEADNDIGYLVEVLFCDPNIGINQLPGYNRVRISGADFETTKIDVSFERVTNADIRRGLTGTVLIGSPLRVDIDALHDDASDAFAFLAYNQPVVAY